MVTFAIFRRENRCAAARRLVREPKIEPKPYPTPKPERKVTAFKPPHINGNALTAFH